MRRCRGGEVLHPGDRAEEVLEDNDFVQLGMLIQVLLPDRVHHRVIIF